MMKMKLISVNIGKAQAIENAKSSGKTGIYKQPVISRVQIHALGLAGDTICDTENHGGVDQAVYVYGMDDYAWWAGELGRDMPPGTFGENLTISGLVSMDYTIGDRFLVGTVILEVTAPRIPCVTIAARMGDPKFPKRFRFAERPGLYCRVIQEGWVQAGDEVRVERYVGETVSALEMFREFYEPQRDEATIRRFLAAPIAIRDRVEKEAVLEKILLQLPSAPSHPPTSPPSSSNTSTPKPITWPPSRPSRQPTPTDRAAFDAHWAKLMADPGIFIQTILYDGQIAGSILTYKGFGDLEVSYWLGREFWDKGIATEALRLFLEVQKTRPLYGR
jgi:MOSC domain-containing protein YiiM